MGVKAKGLSEVEAYAEFKKLAAKRHEEERAEMQTKQMVKRAQEVAKVQAESGDVAAKGVELDGECAAELNALELAHNHGMMKASAALAPTQHEVLQNQQAAW